MTANDDMRAFLGVVRQCCMLLVGYIERRYPDLRGGIDKANR